MSDLLVIGYSNETTAAEAAALVEQLEQDLLIQPDAIAVIRRDQNGRFHVETNHHVVGAATTWGMFWGLLFGFLFFVPLLGVAFGAALGGLAGLIDRSLVNREFATKVRDLLQPGTSALFLMVEHVPSDKVVNALSRYGGTVLRSTLDSKTEAELQEALTGTRPSA
jgi:uncharacterized membrane protein